MERIVKYQRVREEMEKEIRQRGLLPNAPFMTENEAIDLYGVSRITVRQAFELLEQDGLVYRVQGKGCFVAPHEARPSKSVAFLATCIIQNGVESVLLRAIEEYLDRHDYNLLVCNTNNDFNRAERYLQRLVRSRIDAIIFVCISSEKDYSRNADLVRYILNNNIPVVMLDRYAPSIPPEKVFTVTPDNYNAAYEMTRHLISRGHRRISFCGGISCSSQDERIEGCLACLRDHGIEPDPDFVRKVITQEDYLLVSRKYLMMKERPTAIFAVCDESAYYLTNALASFGIDVPRDMAIVGFDDFTSYRDQSLRLTTMRVPLREEGMLAASVVVDLLEGRDITPSHLKVSCELVVRDTCGLPNNSQQPTPLSYGLGSVPA